MRVRGLIDCKGIPQPADSFRLTESEIRERNQLLRASSSIALNLAEGRGKATTKDQRKFFHIAMGSLRESQAILILEELESTESWKMLDRLGAHLFRLIERLR